ncbi:MAG TPA: S8 family serine peptidase [Steroidobacteraceae bacterium]|nr:S8 family serine peptidase [Steroidobacteraceae bacterium]
MESQKSGAKLAWLGLSIAVAFALAPATASAADETAKLGEGLRQLVAAPAEARASARTAAASGEPEATVTSPVQFDDANRALVRISLDGSPTAPQTLGSLKQITGVEVVASDLSYGPGLVEAYVPVEQILSIARTRGVLAIVPSSPMVTNVGATDSQGVVQHRVDKLPAGVDGSGITVGAMSDSYDTNVAPNSAALDIASGDLPGAGNPAGNTEPVVVLQDSPARTDEGRAMLQIVHDLAPKAKLGFATAQGGQLNFANNIRALAGDPTAPNFRADFKADVIVDDIIYLDEPFFQDGIVAQAVDEVVAKGVAYFSSAGNRPASQAYDSKIRIVPGNASSWANTNLIFTNVPAALYAGGFHNFAASGAVDIAQNLNFTINPGSSNNVVLQWNEPFDSTPPTAIGAPFASGTGTVPTGSFAEFTFSGTAGQAVMIFVDGDTTTTGTSIPDIVLELYSPTNVLVATKDTGTNPEFIALELPATGTFRVRVISFVPTQGGDFRYEVSNAELPEPVLSNFNLLFFRSTGEFIGALAEQNTLTNRPIELGGINATISVQIVIARANTPAPSRLVADRIRWVGFGNVSPQEYVSYLNPVTYGHNSAAGAMGVAAYPFFAPFVPEGFTSPGPSTIYFDRNSRRLRHAEIRQKPDLAAMDGANNTFFSQDSAVDADTFPNFFGTSAAAPHAAAIAALVLDAAGGPGSVKPRKMREILQDSAFAHDLDPYFSWGFGLSRGNLLSINASADPNAFSQFDPNVFTVTHFGTRALANLSINGTGANPTNSPGGIVFDERTAPLPAPGQPFVVGRTHGLSPLDAVGTFSLPADPPGVAGQWKQLDITFQPGTFGSGDLLSFGVDRDETDVSGPNGAAGGNSADLLGGGVLIPSGQFVPGGASFFGRFEGGHSFRGEFFNLLGDGYSQLDGYGFVNAEAAVKAVQKKRK